MIAQDFCTSDHCNHLWICEIHNLEVKNNESKLMIENQTVSFKFVSVFGTIIEIRDMFEKGILYTVDDGTGVILCKYNPAKLNIPVLCKVVEEEKIKLLNNSCMQKLESSSMLSNESHGDDDTIFNDKLIQKEDKESVVIDHNKALESLWNDISSSYEDACQALNVGDIVKIDGRIYTYFNKKQIYVNCIRKLSYMEESLKIKIKLHDSLTREGDKSEVDNVTDKKSLITFDNVHTSEWISANITLPTTPASKVECLANRQISTPPVSSVITFDSLMYQETKQE